MSTQSQMHSAAEYLVRMRGNTRTAPWAGSCPCRGEQLDDRWAGPGDDAHDADVHTRRLALLRDAVLVSGSVMAGAIAGGLVWMLFPDHAAGGVRR